MEVQGKKGKLQKMNLYMQVLHEDSMNQIVFCRKQASATAMIKAG